MDKLPNLRVRVVHGNTLTAAVILNEIPKDVEEVFLTGATSKLGRAIALYLCRRKIKVLVCPLLFFLSFSLSQLLLNQKKVVLVAAPLPFLRSILKIFY